MSAIRAATILTVWGAAFREGKANADDLLSHLGDTGFTAGVRAADLETALRSGLPGPGAAGAGPMALLELLRGGGAPLLVLPVPGDLRGLAPNSPALVPALDAGAAVVLPMSGLVIVPTGGTWRVFPTTTRASASTVGPSNSDTSTSVPSEFTPSEFTPSKITPAEYTPSEFAPSILEAEMELDSAIRSATKRLMSLDIARDSARVRDEIADQMRAAAIPLPRGTHRSASALLAKVVSLQSLLSVAATYETGAVSRYELGAVDDALRPLAAAVRAGRLAAVSVASGAKQGTGFGGSDGRGGIGSQQHSDQPV